MRQVPVIVAIALLCAEGAAGAAVAATTDASRVQIAATASSATFAQVENQHINDENAVAADPAAVLPSGEQIEQTVAAGQMDQQLRQMLKPMCAHDSTKPGQLDQHQLRQICREWRLTFR